MPMAIGIGSGIKYPSGGLITFLLRDEFLTDVDAGSVDGSDAEPGPGSRIVTDGDDKLIILSDALRIQDHSTPAWGDPRLRYCDPADGSSAFTRAAGLAFLAKLHLSVATEKLQIGWSSQTTGGANTGHSFYFRVNEDIRPSDNSNVAEASVDFLADTDYLIAIVMRGTGAYYFLHTDAWYLIWVSESISTDQYAVVAMGNEANLLGSIDWIRIGQLPAPFDTELGFCTDSITGRALTNLDQISIEPNFVMQLTVTTLASTNPIWIDIIYQDNTNKYNVRILADGQPILREIVDGASSDVASGSPGDISNGDVLTIIRDGSQIDIFAGGTSIISYSSASYFTDAVLADMNNIAAGGRLDDWLSFPRSPSGGALAALIARTGDYGSQELEFLYRDEFEIAMAAGALDGSPCVPGPDVRDVTDTNNLMSISGGKLTWSSALGGTNNPRLYKDATFNRVAGLALLAEVTAVDLTSVAIGFEGAKTGWPNDIGLTFGAAGPRAYYVGAAMTNAYPAGGISDNYKIALITNSDSRAGGLHFIKHDSNDWRLLFAYELGSGNVYAGVSQHSANVDTAELSFMRVAHLPAPFDEDRGYLTEVLDGARSAGDTFEHEADCIIQFTCTTVPSAGDDMLVTFRKQDDDNYWQVGINESGDINLYEIVDGAAPATRAGGASSVSDGDIVSIVADDENIFGVVNLTRRFIYSSAANFKTATSGEIENEGASGAIDDLLVYPLYPSGDALEVLEAYAADTI